MRKIALIFMLLFYLSGCSNVALPSAEDVAKTYSQDFSANVIGTFGKNKTEIEVLKNGMSISFLLDFPKELSGMEVVLSDEHARVIFEGMEQEINTENLPEGTPFLLLEELFEELSDPEDFVLSTENENLVANSDDFTAVLSAEDYSLISAEFSQYATKFTFSDFAFGNAK